MKNPSRKSEGSVNSLSISYFLFLVLALGLTGKFMTARTILLVNDEGRVKEIVLFSLQDLAGWRVFSTISGEKGLKIAATLQIDAILLDVLISDMDSITFLQQLRANPLTKAIPVILLSVDANSLKTQPLELLQVVGAIENPFLPLTLPNQIATFVGWNNS
jgi:CheY-like chemotaxis protein